MTLTDAAVRVAKARAKPYKLWDTGSPIGEIPPAEVLQVLKKIEKRGLLETARRAR